MTLQFVWITPLLYSAKDILVFLGQNDVIAGLAGQYLRAALPGMWAYCMYESYASFLRNQSKPHAPTPKTSVNVTVSCGNETVVATDVLFGDLWWCGGQSNMCVPTTAVYDSGPALAKLDAYPNVRYFQALAGLWEPGFAGTATTAARDVPAGGHWKTIADARGGAATCWSTSGVGHT